jgi:hypothetical protein
MFYIHSYVLPVSKCRNRKKAKEDAGASKPDDPKNGGNGKKADEDPKADAKGNEDVKVESKDGRRTPLHARDMDPVKACLHETQILGRTTRICQTTRICRATQSIGRHNLSGDTNFVGRHPLSRQIQVCAHH